MVAVTEGTEPRVGVGLLIILEPCCEVDNWVIEEAVEDPVGLNGRGGPEKVAVDGDGPGIIGLGFASEGDVARVGVGRGVVLAEDGAVLILI